MHHNGQSPLGPVRKVLCCVTAFQVFLSLQHLRKFRKVRFQPVLLLVSQRGFFQVGDHLVDGIFQCFHLAFGFYADGSGKSPLVTADATSEIERTCVVRFCASWFTFSVRFFQIPDAPGTLACPPKRPIHTHFSGHGGYLVGKHRKRIDHFVDGINQLGHFTTRNDGQFLFQVTRCNSRYHFGNTTYLAGKIGCHHVHRVGKILPGTAHTLYFAWPPSLPSVPTSRATRVTSKAKEFN